MLYDYAAFFFIYGFLGWCVEVIFKALQKGILQNRGFLNGAICPIYGFGLCAVILCLEPCKDNLVVLYLGSVAVTTALELVTGFLMDKLFHKRWWDYSTMPLNIHGYVCLLFSLIWGIACVLFLKLVHPLVAELVGLVPRSFGVALLSVLGVLFAADTLLTVLTVLRLNEKLRRIDELSSMIKEQSDKLTGVLYRNAIKAGGFTEERFGGQIGRLKDRYVELMEKGNVRKEEIEEYLKHKETLIKLRLRNEKLRVLSFGQRRLLRAFPDAKSTDGTASIFEQLKALLHKGAGKPQR